MLRDTPGPAPWRGEHFWSWGLAPQKSPRGAVGGLLLTISPGCYLSWRGDSDTHPLTSCIFVQFLISQ